jgi:hypothetical protein
MPTDTADRPVAAPRFRIKIADSSNNFSGYLKFRGEEYVTTNRSDADQVARDMTSQYAPNRYYTVERIV